MRPLASLGPLQRVLATGAMAFVPVSVPANSLPFRRYSPDHDDERLGRSAGRAGWFRWTPCFPAEFSYKLAC